MNKNMIPMLPGITLMAFAKGAASKEAPEFKYYTGLASAQIVGINPTAEELKKIYPNRDNIQEPAYTSMAKNQTTGVESPRVRIDFYLKTQETESAPSMILRASYFLTKTHRFNKDNTKVQVIDEYGRTAWVTKAEFDAHAIPVSSKTGNPLNISYPYRQVWTGEEDIVNFLKTFMCIDDPMKAEKQDDGTYKWYYRSAEELENCKADFSEIEKYFTGNIKEIKDIVSYQPDNKIQVLVGVRSYDGKMFQDVFTQLVLRNNATSTKQLEKVLAEQKEAGRYADTTFLIQPIAEYNVQASTFTQADNMPFEAESDMPSW